MADEKKLTDEELDGISGGMIEADPLNLWEIIDNKNGEILGRSPNRERDLQVPKECLREG